MPQGKLAPNETADLDLLQAIAGSSGTIKLNATDVWTGNAKALIISEDAVITTLTDDAETPLTKTSYFSSATFAAKVGDRFVPIRMIEGRRFKTITLASGTGMIVL